MTNEEIVIQANNFISRLIGDLLDPEFGPIIRIACADQFYRLQQYAIPETTFAINLDELIKDAYDLGQEKLNEAMRIKGHEIYLNTQWLASFGVEAAFELLTPYLKDNSHD